MKSAAVLAVAAAAMLASGCTGLKEVIQTNANSAETKASHLVRDVGQVASSGRTVSSAVHENGIWIGRHVIKRAPVSLPAIFYEPATFDRDIASLSELAERITLRSGIPARIAPDARQAFASNNGAASRSAGGPGALPPASSQIPAISPTPASAATGAGPVHIMYSGGTFKGFLDTVAARFGIFWKYADGTIQFFYTDTRTFQIAAVPGDSALVATVASGATNSGDSKSGSSGGLSSDNMQNTAVKSELSVYPSIEKAISAMLSRYGKVVASPATGTITVSDTPDRLDRIAQFIQGQNKALSRQVMVNVTVLAVSVSNNDNYGINWNLIYNNLQHRYGVRNTVTADPTSTSFSAAILDTAASKLAGSTLVIDALSQQGTVHRETSASVVTLNNQPVPVQVATQTSYLKSSQTTLTASVGSSTTLTPGTVTSGFNMSILPHILDNGTVMLQFSTDISSLRTIRTVKSDTGSIETPEVDTRNFLQRVAMRSNETLIISGFEQTDDNLDRHGVGTPTNLLLGGGLNAQANKQMIVILITPVLV